MKFSIVIPTFNRRETLAEVLPSLAHQQYPTEDYEILVCDAGSTDGTLELLEELAIPNLRVLPGGDSGRGGARNRGIRDARGQIVLFTDADIIADPNLLAEHERSHRQFPGDPVVGCEIQVDSLEEYYAYRQDPSAHARHRPDRRTLPWHYFLTGNASVNRETLVEVGMFDENFTGYGHEDLELGYRLLARGLTIRYNPQAINYHWHPVPFDEQCRKMRLAGVSTVRFYNKHKDLRIPLIMGWNPLSLLVHALIARVPTLYRWLEARTPDSHLAREIVLQYHYLSGIKEAR
ncbi:MAG: glycosyltransferase family 2 protein [Vulcanimicrobiota bacterium]